MTTEVTTEETKTEAKKKSPATYFVPWSRRKVIITFADKAVGGLPASKNLIDGWLQRNMPDAPTSLKKELADATAEAVKARMAEASDAVLTTFGIDTKGVYLEGRCVKSAFKECANILRDVFQKQENAEKKSRFTSFKARAAEKLHIEETRCYFEREGKVLTETEARGCRPVHVDTAQGPRTALKSYDYMLPGVQLCFHIRWLNDGQFDEALLQSILDFMQWNGLGSDRSQGSGRFTYAMADPTMGDTGPQLPAPAKPE